MWPAGVKEPSWDLKSELKGHRKSVGTMACRTVHQRMVI